MTRHPAKFTDALLPVAAELLGPAENRTLYDPFAGVGKGVEYMEAQGFRACGTELEPEWAEQSNYVACAESLAFMETQRPIVTLEHGIIFPPWDVVFTSPTYGNRMADHHDARDASRRNTYRHSLGRPLSDGSSATMQWGPEYQAFHRRAWQLVYLVVKPGGSFLLNVKDHIRQGSQVPTTDWHHEVLTELGFQRLDRVLVDTPGNRQGANGRLRVHGEWLLLYRKPEA